MAEGSRHSPDFSALRPNWHKLFPFLSVFIFCCLVGGCAPGQISNPGFNANATYAAPEGLTAAAAASLVGSQDKTTNPLSRDASVFLSSVDDKPVDNGWRGWNEPVLVTPGEHYIELSECVCGLFGGGPVGGAYVEVVIKAGETYTLRATPPVQAHIFAPISADGWVADENGALISRVVDDNGNLVTEKSHFFLVPQSGGPDTVPIFLPAK